MKRGFTLIELLVVIAIIAILAAILFPVFAQARLQAKKTACQSNFNQIGKAMEMYKTDNDQKYAPTNLDPYTFHFPDKPWTWTIQSYVKNWNVYSCPGDPNQVDKTLERNVETNAACAPTDTNCKYYGRGTLANIGLNMQNLSPLACVGSHCGGWGIKDTRNQAPSKCILAVDSIWDRDPVSGAPIGGGNWALDPPANKLPDNTNTLPLPAGYSTWWWFGGWNPSKPLAWNFYGGCWPWHGSCTVIFTDTHVKNLKPLQLAEGCDLQDGWTGFILDRDKYLWDLQ